jgi:hypothetical protein
MRSVTFTATVKDTVTGQSATATSNFEDFVTTSVNGWYDVTAYGATGNGTTDDTVGCQSAITTCIANGGGVVYFPTGQYLTSSALNVDTSTTHVPVYFQGTALAGGNNVNTAGGTTIIMTAVPSSTVSTYGVNVTGGGVSSGCAFRFADITIVSQVQNTTATSTVYDAIHVSEVPWVNVERYSYMNNQLHQGNGANTGLHVIGAYETVIEDCAIHAEVQSIWADCTQGMVIRDCWLSATNGSGYGAIRFDDSAGISEEAGSIQISNVVTGQGDWGFYSNGSGNQPCFIVADNFQINNPRAGGMYFGAGSQVWLDYVWISFAGTPSSYLTYGILCDTSFEGWLYMNNSVIQSPSGHGMWLKNGQGFNIYGTSFGGCGHYNANNYDDVHVSVDCSNVSVNSSHFDVDKYNTINGARSAVYVEEGAGAVLLNGNIFGEDIYHTDTVIDNGRTVVASGNIGWQYPWINVTLDSGWSNVSGYAPLRYRFAQDGNLQVDGLAQYSSNLTSNVNINSGTPLIGNAQPEYTAYFPGNTNGRAPVQVNPSGVLEAIGMSGSTNRYAEFHDIIPLN